jgi:hypothetical protein
MQAATAELLANPDRLDVMAARSREHVLTHHTIENEAQRLQLLYICNS